MNKTSLTWTISGLITVAVMAFALVAIPAKAADKTAESTNLAQPSGVESSVKAAETKTMMPPANISDQNISGSGSVVSSDSLANSLASKPESVSAANVSAGSGSVQSAGNQWSRYDNQNDMAGQGSGAMQPADENVAANLDTDQNVSTTQDENIDTNNSADRDNLSNRYNRTGLGDRVTGEGNIAAARYDVDDSLLNVGVQNRYIGSGLNYYSGYNSVYAANSYLYPTVAAINPYYASAAYGYNYGYDGYYGSYSGYNYWNNWYFPTATIAVVNDPIVTPYVGAGIVSPYVGGYTAPVLASNLILQSYQTGLSTLIAGNANYIAPIVHGVRAIVDDAVYAFLNYETRVNPCTTIVLDVLRGTISYRNWLGYWVTREAIIYA